MYRALLGPCWWAPGLAHRGMGPGPTTLLAAESALIAMVALAPSRSHEMHQLRDAGHQMRNTLPVLPFALLLATDALSVDAASAVMPPASYRLAKRFEGDYADRLHPLCERHVTVDREAQMSAMEGTSYFTAHFSGNDVGPPGIGPIVFLPCDDINLEKQPLREWSFDARISGDGLRVNAGDEVHVGLWHVADTNSEASSENWEGIKWKDGNRWTRIPSSDKPSQENGS